MFNGNSKQRFASDLEQCLWMRVGERPEPSAQARCEDHGFHKDCCVDMMNPGGDAATKLFSHGIITLIFIALFHMNNGDVDVEFRSQVVGQPLGTVNGAVLTTGASK